MEKVLVTGATGFIGSWLTRDLVKQGYEVHVVYRDESRVAQVSGFMLGAHMHRSAGSLNSLRLIVSEIKPAVIFHLASLVLPWHRPADIEDLVLSNVLFGCQLLEGFAQAGGGIFVNAGTYAQHFETTQVNPANFYAATKQAFEEVLKFYCDARSVQGVTLKLFDVYGPGDRRKKIFGLLNDAFKTGQELRMSPGGQKLDLIYITDVLKAFEHVLTLLNSGGIKEKNSCFFVGTGRLLTVREIVEIYKRVTQRSVSIAWGGIPYRARQIMTPQRGNCLPGWKAEVDLETGLRLMMQESDHISVLGSR